MTTEEMNALGEWWKYHSNDHEGLVALLGAKQITLQDFAHATGQHEASLAEWLIEHGAPANVGGYNKMDPKWDFYFGRVEALPVTPPTEDSRFSIGGKI